MAVSFKNIDRVPVAVVGAVDAEGAEVAVDAATFEWTVESANGLDIGTIEVDPTDNSKAVFVSGVAGAEGFVKVTATFPDGKTLDGTSELVKLTTSEAVSFRLSFGQPL